MSNNIADLVDVLYPKTPPKEEVKNIPQPKPKLGMSWGRPTPTKSAPTTSKVSTPKTSTPFYEYEEEKTNIQDVYLDVFNRR